MATFTEFVNQLVNDVALAGSRGIAAEDLERAVRSWHTQTVIGVPASLATTTTSKAASDGVVNAVWSALEQRRDIEITLLATAPGAARRAPRNEGGNFSSQFAGTRVFTTAERTWRTITGHGINKAVVPELQFALLSIIAAHGPQGILQPDMNKWAKQDKRSVPKRTDDLAKNGYIIKHRVIVGRGNQTTLLKLRRFATGEVSGPRHVKAYSDDQTWKSGDIVYFDTWFNETLRLIRQNEGIITTEDLRIGMGIHRQVRVRRTFGKCIDRIVKTGLLRKLKAQLQPDVGQESQLGLVNCLHLLREPTNVDRDAFSDPFDKVRAKGKMRRASKSKYAKETEHEAGSGEGTEDESENEDAIGSEMSDSDSDDAEPRSEAAPNRSTYSLRNRDKSAKLIDALQDLGSDTPDDDELIATPGANITRKSRSSAPTNRGSNSTVKKDDFLLVTPSWSFNEWGFTKLQPCFFLDQQGRRNFVGGQSAARSPFKLINKRDDGNGVTFLDASPSRHVPSQALPEPGAYINPPDAVAKARFARRRKHNGMLPESMIVVIKSNKLKNLRFLKPTPSKAPPPDQALILPKRKRGRPSKAAMAQREAQERVLRESQHSSSGVEQGRTHHFSTARQSSVFETNGYYHGHPPPSVSARQVNHLSSVNGTPEPGSTHSYALKRKRDQILNVDSDRSKRPKSDGSLIAKLPAPRWLLSDLEKNDKNRNAGPEAPADLINDATVRPDSIVPSTSPSTIQEPSGSARNTGTASDTTNGPSPFDIHSSASTSGHPRIPRDEPYLRVSTSPTAATKVAAVEDVMRSGHIQVPSAEGVHPGAPMIPRATHLAKPAVQSLPTDYSHIAQPKRRRLKASQSRLRDNDVIPQSASRDSIVREMEDTDEALVARQFPEVSGVVVRRTATGLATINNAELVYKTDSLEVMSRPSRAYAFTGEVPTYKDTVSIDLVSCQTFTDHQRRSLMYPGQIYHPASGTIGTVGATDQISSKGSSVEISWKMLQTTPNYLADLLYRAETLDCAKTGRNSTPTERFASEIECVRILEEKAEDDHRLMDFGEGPIFVIHGLDCQTLPRSRYALKVEAHDFHLRQPPFDEDFMPRPIMIQTSPPRRRSSGTTSKKGEGRSRTSRKPHPLLPVVDNFPSGDSSLEARTFSAPAKTNTVTGTESTDPARRNSSSYVNGPPQRFYRGPDMPSGPMLTLMRYGAPSTPSPTPFVSPAVRAPPTPEASTNAGTNSARSSADTDGSQRPADTRSESRPKPRMPDKANDDDACDTCKRNHRTCYGGSATERCSFCAPTGALCSRVERDAITLANLAAREKTRLAKAAEQDHLMQMARRAPVVSQQPAVNAYVHEEMCSRCRNLGKSQCIGGSATTRCGLCKTRRGMCSKNDVDRAKLIQWGRYTPEKPETPASSQRLLLPSNFIGTPLPSSVYSIQYHDRLPISPWQSNLPGNDVEQSPAVGQKRKRTYAYKAKEALKEVATANVEESVNQALRRGSNDYIDSPSSLVGQSPGLARPPKPKKPPFEDPQRLCIAVALSNLLCGGGASNGDEINWDAVTHALAFKHEKSTLQKWWSHQTNWSSFFEQLKRFLGEEFLHSYENGEAPAIDFDDLTLTDWPALVRWVESEVLPVISHDTLSDLPKSKMEFYAGFDVPSASQHFKASEHANITDPASNVKDILVAKSFIRALVMTPEEDYNADSATRKLSSLHRATRDEAVEQLQKSHTIMRKKAGRQLPGRNYLIHKECLSQFARWRSRDNEDDFTFLRKVAEAWNRFTRHFAIHKRSTISPLASEADRLVITNMVAQGHLKMTAKIPALDKELLQQIQNEGTLSFPVEYTTTPKFSIEHALKSDVPIPSEPSAPLSKAIPFWVDINGNLIDEVWDMVLRSVLHLLVFSPGSTTEGVEEAHGGQLGDWEIEIVFKWMERVGVAEKCGNTVGWRPTEWWYLAFSDEVATWEAHDSAMGDD